MYSALGTLVDWTPTLAGRFITSQTCSKREKHVQETQGVGYMYKILDRIHDNLGAYITTDHLPYIGLIQDTDCS